MNPTLLNTLKVYVDNGGTLVLNAYQSMYNSMFVEDKEFYGYQFSRFSDNWLASDRLNPAGTIRMQDNMAYMPSNTYSTSNWFYSVNGVVDGADVVAYSQNGNQLAPVVVRNDYGRGQVYLTLTEYMMTGQQLVPTRLDFYNDLLKAIVLENNSTVKVFAASEFGTNDISYQASFQGEDLVVLLSNLGTTDGYVDVVINTELSPAAINVDVGHYKDKSVSTAGGKTTIRVQTKAGDISLLRIAYA